MKVFIQFVAPLFLFSFFISCDPAPSKLKALSDFIPKNPLVVFSINDFETLKSDLRNNSFLSNLKMLKLILISRIKRFLSTYILIQKVYYASLKEMMSPLLPL